MFEQINLLPGSSGPGALSRPKDNRIFRKTEHRCSIPPRPMNRTFNPSRGAVRGLTFGILLLAATGQVFGQTTIVGNVADAQVSSASVNATANPILAGFSGNTGYSAVFVFQLPTLPAGHKFYTANFSAYLYGKDGTPAFNGDLYGLGFRSSATVLTSDFYAGPGQSGVTLIQDNYVVPTSGSATMSTNDQGDAVLGAYLNTQYKAGGAGKFVFIRVSPDAVMTNNYTRYKFNTAEAAAFYQPKLVCSSLPSPLFASTSFWNTKLASNAPLNADQSDVTDLVAQVQAYNTNFNTYQYSVPIWVADAGEATITVTDTNDGFMTSRWGAVPWPPNATGAAGSDAHCVIWQPSTDTLWEFFKAGGTYPNITATHGGKMTTMMSDDGVYPSPYGATATGLSVAAGIVSLIEADQILVNSSYVIPHALGMSICVIDSFHVAPATRHDASPPLGGATAIPEGRRFRLPATYNPDVSIPNAPPLTKALARAARDYGIVVRDRAGNVVLYGEDAKTRAYNPWNSTLYGGKGGYDVIDSFPWSSLQVLQ